MNVSRFVSSLALGLALVALSACGGNGHSSGSAVTTPTPPITTPAPPPPAPQPSSGLSLAPRVDLATGGTHAGSIALADFNGDGKLDIAVSNFSSNTITVFLNKGNGTFSAPVVTAVQIPNDLGAIVTGDFNEDGKPDLIAATVSGPQANIVLLGNGDGTFTQMAAIPNSFGFFSARVVDLNGDKHLDLIAAGNGNMSVALGKGDGTFTPMTYLGNGPLPNTFFGMDVGNLRGDGKLDIVGANWGSFIGDVVVFSGNGDGTFQAPTSASTGLTGPDSVALADFNGDGKLDLLIGYSPGSAAVAFGNGDGTFNVGLHSQTFIYSSDLPSSSNGVAVRAADIDFDGKPDALIADFQTGVFTIVLNDASQISAGSTHTYAIAPGLSDIAVGDLNGDGVLDVVLANSMTNQISIFLSQR